MEIQAAIGISQLKDLDIFIQKRRNLAISIDNAVSGSGLELVGAITLLNPETERSHSWMLMPIRVIGQNSYERKKRIVAQLENLGIETRPVLTGNFISQPSMQRIGRNLPDATEFKIANEISATTFLVSGHHDLDTEQINFLSSTLKHVGLENLN
jgi:CDP-6-deoxy-D-xylo-4-hexulose-3-dehydrase